VIVVFVNILKVTLSNNITPEVELLQVEIANTSSGILRRPLLGGNHANIEPMVTVDVAVTASVDSIV
jgi:hypothetical protein